MLLWALFEEERLCVVTPNICEHPKMKQRIIVMITVVMAFSGCASLGNKKPPHCNGMYTRALNKGHWDWNNKGVVLPEKSIRPVVKPIILNQQDSEKAEVDVTFNIASLGSLNHNTPSYTNCKGRGREK